MMFTLSVCLEKNPRQRAKIAVVFAEKLLVIEPTSVEVNSLRKLMI